MSTSSTESIPLIPIRESSKWAVVFMIELPREQTLSPAFMNPDIIAGLVYEHTTIETMVVQRLDERNTLLIHAEGENIEKLCSTLQSIKICLGHSVNTGCHVAPHEQMMAGDWLHQLGDSTQKREVLFELWAFEVRSVMQSRTRGNIEGGNSMIFMWSHGWPWLILWSTSPSGRNNK